MSEGNYGLPDVRLLMAGRNAQFLPAMREAPVVVEHFPSSHDYHRSLTVATLPSPHHFDSFNSSGGGGGMFATGGATGGALVDFGHHDSSAASTTTHTGAQAMCGLELESGYNLGNDMGGGNGRWPRQETLTLLEIRSRLDFKFKEANQKGPLWDEVSRIMAEENGYQRSGKKCREKFENLYKYYKKTKEGKAGRQDGKHYRFFRQLEAIYGESSTNNNLNQLQETNLSIRNKNMSLLYNHQPPPHQENQDLPHHHHHIFQEHKISGSQLSFSDNNNNLSEFETSSSDNNNNDDQDLSTIAFMKSKRVARRSWKWKVKEFIDLQMRKLMETQEAWMERMLRAIEEKEKERVWKDEEWRRQDVARVDQEHEFWAKERAWMEARDVALMEALKKITNVDHNHQDIMINDHHNVDMFCDIMNKMKSKEEETRTCNYSQKLDLYQDHQQEDSRSKRAQESEMMRLQLQKHEENVGGGGINNVVSNNSNVGFLHMNNEEMWWDKYGLKLSNNEKYQQG